MHTFHFCATYTAANNMTNTLCKMPDIPPQANLDFLNKYS